MPSLPQWNESATDHAAALVYATSALQDSSDVANDYPLAMNDTELGDFLMDAMGHVAHGTVPPAPMNELAACDALHILGDLPHPPMNLPPP